MATTFLAIGQSLFMVALAGISLAHDSRRGRPGTLAHNIRV